jgi:hypothetical protein
VLMGDGRIDHVYPVWYDRLTLCSPVVLGGETVQSPTREQSLPGEWYVG